MYPDEDDDLLPIADLKYLAQHGELAQLQDSYYWPYPPLVTEESSFRSTLVDLAYNL